MRRCAKVVLAALTAVVPVFIAACYGTQQGLGYCSGRVLDRKTKTPVAGIEVACLMDGAPVDADQTWTSGAFSLSADETCDALQMTDADGAMNGAYRTTTLGEPSCDGADVFVDPQ